MDPFEQRLARPRPRPTPSRRRRPSTPRDGPRGDDAPRPVRSGAGLERAWPPAIDRRLLPLLVAAGLVIALVALALAGGSTPQPPLDDLARLVFVRDGDLFVSAIDGTGATMIRERRRRRTRSLGYLTALWSPGHAPSIAAVRDVGGPVLTPAIDILGAGRDGASGPSSPGRAGRRRSRGRRTARASRSPPTRRTCRRTPPSRSRRAPADHRRARRRLARDRRCPPDAEWLADADAEIWTFPDLGVRWSPDGRWIAVAWERSFGGRLRTWSPPTARPFAASELVRRAGAASRATSSTGSRTDGAWRRWATWPATTSSAWRPSDATAGPEATPSPHRRRDARTIQAESARQARLPAVSPDGDRIADQHLHRRLRRAAGTRDHAARLRPRVGPCHGRRLRGPDAGPRRAWRGPRARHARGRPGLDGRVRLDRATDGGSCT